MGILFKQDEIHNTKNHPTNRTYIHIQKHLSKLVHNFALYRSRLYSTDNQQQKTAISKFAYAPKQRANTLFQHSLVCKCRPLENNTLKHIT